MNASPRSRTRAYLQLMRLPNVFTALADILAGYFLAPSPDAHPFQLGFLLMASACLYTGGIVLNDFFDYATDCRERPERPLPSGQIGRAAAGMLGSTFLLFGCLSATAGGGRSVLIAAVLAGLIVSYDAVTKNTPGLGSINMGACRFFNFFLGMSLAPVDRSLLMVPILNWVYVIAITSLSKGEVEGGSREPATRALALLLGVVGWYGLLYYRQILPNALAWPA